MNIINPLDVAIGQGFWYKLTLVIRTIHDRIFTWSPFIMDCIAAPAFVPCSLGDCRQF